MAAPLVERVVAHPLRVRLPATQTTAQGDYPAVQILVVEIRTDDGVTGYGEGLVRKGAAAAARLVDDELAPLLVGQPVWSRRALWRRFREITSGRAGGRLLETMAAIDIALWDACGKTVGEPIYRLLGGMGRETFPAYASSINWAEPERVEREIAAAVDAGFREIKVKIGSPVRDAIARAAFARELVGDDIRLYADANWAFDLPDAILVGRALAELGYDFFEEPLKPADRDGYRHLARSVPIRIAAGESDFVAGSTLEFLRDRSLGLIQPDVSRAGGLTETWRIAEMAAAFDTAYAPHVGWSGTICEAASLHLAAAAETTRTFEKMVFPNPLREEMATYVGGPIELRDGCLSPPQAPGLGIDVDEDFLARHAIS